MENSINERFNKVFEYLKTNKIVRNQVEFCQKVDVYSSDMSKYLNGKKDISKKLLEKIADSFPISLDWLLTGEGEMLVSSQGSGAADGQSEPVSEILKVLAGQLHEKDQQIERLLGIIEKFQ